MQAPSVIAAPQRKIRFAARRLPFDYGTNVSCGSPSSTGIGLVIKNPNTRHRSQQPPIFGIYRLGRFWRVDVLARAQDFLAVGFSLPPAPVPRSGSLRGKAKLKPAAGAGSGWRLLFWLMAYLLRLASAWVSYPAGHGSRHVQADRPVLARRRHPNSGGRAGQSAQAIPTEPIWPVFGCATAVSAVLWGVVI